MPRLKKSILNKQGRIMLYDVLSYMKKDAEASGVANRAVDIYKRTADATNTSVATVRRIVKEASDPASFKTPNKKKPRHHPVTDLDSFERGFVRRCIHNFHKTNKELPTIEKLRRKLRDDMNFQGSEGSLRRIIKRMGFKWKKIENKRGALIEKSNIRVKRIEYLRQLKQYREEGRPIIYTGEFYVESSDLCPSSTTNQPTKGNKTRLVIIHAASETGFVPNSLVTFLARNKTENYHTYISNENYENWLRNQLITNIPPKAVVVVGNEAYHNKQYDPAPEPYAKKSDMLAWLEQKGIDHDKNMLKPQLYDLIKNHKNEFKKFTIDQILAGNETKVLRLPPYHSDLNPVETAWDSIKRLLGSERITWNAKHLRKLIQDKMDLMDARYWEKLYADLKVIEEEYRINEHVIDLMTEELEFLADVDDSDSSSSSGSEQTDEDDECEDEVERTDTNTTSTNFFEYIKVETHFEDL